MSYFNAVQYSDTANLDAFSRLRVSNVTPLLDAQFTYDMQPLQFDTIVTGTAATTTYDSTNRCVKAALTASISGSSAYFQSYKYLKYTSGTSQLIFISFNMGGGVANVTKWAQY